MVSIPDPMLVVRALDPVFSFCTRKAAGRAHGVLSARLEEWEIRVERPV